MRLCLADNVDFPENKTALTKECIINYVLIDQSVLGLSCNHSENIEIIE